MQVESQHYSWSDVMKCVVSLLEMTFKPNTVAYRLAVSSRLRLFSLQAIADLLQCHCKLLCLSLYHELTTELLQCTSVIYIKYFQ